MYFLVFVCLNTESSEVNLVQYFMPIMEISARFKIHADGCPETDLDTERGFRMCMCEKETGRKQRNFSNPHQCVTELIISAHDRPEVKSGAMSVSRNAVAKQL